MCSSGSLSFNLHFTNNVEHLFTCLFSTCISSSVNYPFMSFRHISLGCLFSFYCILRVLFILWIQIFYQIDDLCNFLPVCALSFHFLNGIFRRAEIFWLKSNLLFFLFHGPCCDITRKPLTNPKS